MKDTKKNFYNRFNRELGKEYTLLSEYVDYNHTKIKVRHNACGYEYKVLPSTIFKGHGCPACFGNQRYTTETFKKKVYSLVEDEYTVLSEYSNNKKKIIMRHNKCGYNYAVKPNAFLTGSRCPNCAKNKKYTLETFKNKVEELTGNEYEVIGEYVNARTKILMKHIKCGCEYLVAPSSFISGRRCPNCFKSVPYTTEEYKRKVFELVGDRYTVLGEYVNSKTKILMRHNVCGNTYEVKPLMFFVGNRCPKCSLINSRSLPEEIVAYFISKYFDIKQNYRPDWLRFDSGNNVEIDIWIPKLSIGIEYDGAIHKVNQETNRDIEKNKIIEQSNKIRKLYRIREKDLLDIESSDKLIVLKAKKTISLTSNRGIDELERLINVLLSELCKKNIKEVVTNDIIVECRNNIENYYANEGKIKQSYKKGNTNLFKKRVYELVNDEYEVLSEYVDAHTKILMKHNNCGYEYKVQPCVFLSGRRCPNCAKNKQYTAEEYNKIFYKIFKDEFVILDEYINSKTPIRIKHIACNNVFEIRPRYFLKHPNCPKCSNRVKYTHEFFVEKVKLIYDDEYEILGKYVNSKTKILIRHNKCKSEYYVLPTSVLKGKRCPICFKSRAYTTEEIKEKILDVKKGEYELKSEYINKNTLIVVKHNVCGNEFSVMPYHFLNSEMKCKICKK